MMTSSKKSRDFDYYFVFFLKIFCSTTLMQSFITGLGFKTGGAFRHPQVI